MLSRVCCASTIGVDARLIEVEVSMSGGLPKYFLVGLPDRSVSESKDRIDAALKNSGARFPRGRITVNLAPADLPKEGSAFDLPIAVSLLAVSDQIQTDKLDKCLILGELALDGELRPIRGVLPMAVEARDRGLSYVVVPKLNGNEAAVVDGIEVMAFQTLNEVISWLQDEKSYQPVERNTELLLSSNGRAEVLDFEDVRGQENVKRALEVAAAGGHNAVILNMVKESHFVSPYFSVRGSLIFTLLSASPCRALSISWISISLLSIIINSSGLSFISTNICRTPSLKSVVKIV